MADWKRFVFVHYSLAPADLAPFTPLELDCVDGRAFVSLVFFRLERMRPARFVPRRLGRLLFRPASDSWFLNVRTYVRGPAGTGIQFLVEWMDNRISLILGPRTYGLPYRQGRFDCPPPDSEGRSCLRASDAETGDSITATLRLDSRGPESAALAPLDHFLLERYTAYTHRAGRTRSFRVSHPRWQVTRPNVLEIGGNLPGARCPWFAGAERVSAHASAGFPDVGMGAPRRHF